MTTMAMRSRWLSVLPAALLALPPDAAAAPPGEAGKLVEQAEPLIEREDFAAAEEMLTRAVRMDPASAAAQYRLGYVEFRQRKLAAARTHLGAAVKLDPPAHNARYFLGRVALLESKPREAMAWLEPVVQSGDRTFDAASQLALAYAGAGMPRKAVAALEQAAGSAPWDGALYYRLGRLHQQLGEPELAKQAFQTADRLKNANREDVETLQETARLIAEGRAGEAEAHGRARILGREDADPNSLVALGVLFGRGNLEAPAAAAFERAARRDETLFAAQYNLGLALMRAGRQAEAMTPLRRAAALAPDSADAGLALAVAAVMNDRHAEAIAPLERIFAKPAWAEADRRAEQAALLAAAAYLRTGAAAKAVPLLRRMAAGPKAPVTALGMLTQALAETRDAAGALATARVAAARFPRSSQAQLALARQLTRAGRYQEARPAFEAALAGDESGRPMPEAELGLGDALQKSGEHAAAVERYRAAMASAGTELPARVGMARSLVAMRQAAEARKVLEQGLEAHSDDVGLRLELSRVYARLGEKELAAHEAKIVEQLQQRQQQANGVR